MAKLILLRHGQSEWNKKNLFTGWVDIPLSKEGIEESIAAGKRLADYKIDVVYVSSLVRTQMTALIVMAHSHLPKVACMHHEMDEAKGEGYRFGAEGSQQFVPVYKAWELNERMYGQLQGKNKQEVIDAYGPDQVKLWRRSYDVVPPGGESLEKTAERSIPFFQNKILRDLENGLDVFVCAHGNSLRSIIMKIETLSREQVLELELETGVPRVYQYQQGMFTRIDT